ncbi:MAG TPA: DUF2905 domain-containing protein [Methylibium sp.]|nr:DUF2905 domain-containing protein [Methylibium sp.]
MLRWMIVIVLALIVFNALGPWLRRLGLGRLPGDLNFRFAGRDWSLPIATTVLLSFVAMLIGQLI